MHQAGIFRSSTLVRVVNISGWPLLVVYVYSMFIHPWCGPEWNWERVQNVWDRWQTLNAGALAFLASLIAFNISRFNENQQREREFIASKAFLPSTLSGLMEYLSESAGAYKFLWDKPEPLEAAVASPALPPDYREVFSNCIRHADPVVGAYLSNILVQLQVHEARMRRACSPPPGARTRIHGRHLLISYLYRLGELHALIANLFRFARGEEPFNARALEWADFENAYGILEIDPEDISTAGSDDKYELIEVDHTDASTADKKSLKAFTQRALKRQQSNDTN